MQTQTSNTLHNAIMEAGSKDRPPMLAPGNYVQWKSRIKRYIDTKPNHELIHYCLTSPSYELGWKDKEVPISEGSPITRSERLQETYKNVSQEIRDQLNAKAKAVESINVQDLETNYIGNLENSHLKMCKVTNHQVNVEFLLQLQPEWQRSQQAATRNRGKAIVNSPQPIYDQEPSMVAEDDETSKDKEIDKLMALISLSFKSAGYENQRIGNVAGARETVGSTMVHKSGIQCYNCKEFGHEAREYQELEAHYMYMAQLQEVSPDAANSGPIFDTEPLQNVSNDDHYNVFAIESAHPEQSKSVLDTYLIEQDAHNVIIDSLDMSYNREEIDQNDDDNDLPKNVSCLLL
nr:hypothetical protein [Tanacetum cinerariifolium]